jgi:hypothetical protein
MSDRIPVRLTGLPGQLHAAGYEPVPDYRKLHLKAVNGDIPGARQINSIWHFNEDDIPEIAAALRLKRRTESSPTDRSVPREAA